MWIRRRVLVALRSGTMNNTLLFPGTSRQGPGCSTQAPLELLEGEPHLSIGPEWGQMLMFSFLFFNAP